jgi:hypothetical protein
VSTTNTRPRHEVEEIIVITRLGLYNRGFPCGPAAIRKTMNEDRVRPLPSERTIARILSRRELTHARTGWYDANGASPLQRHNTTETIQLAH